MNPYDLDKTLNQGAYEENLEQKMNIPSLKQKVIIMLVLNYGQHTFQIKSNDFNLNML